MSRLVPSVFRDKFKEFDCMLLRMMSGVWRRPRPFKFRSQLIRLEVLSHIPTKKHFPLFYGSSVLALFNH